MQSLGFLFNWGVIAVVMALLVTGAMLMAPKTRSKGTPQPSPSPLGKVALSFIEMRPAVVGHQVDSLTFHEQQGRDRCVLFIIRREPTNPPFDRTIKCHARINYLRFGGTVPVRVKDGVWLDQYFNFAKLKVGDTAQLILALRRPQEPWRGLEDQRRQGGESVGYVSKELPPDSYDVSIELTAEESGFAEQHRITLRLEEDDTATWKYRGVL